MRSVFPARARENPNELGSEGAQQALEQLTIARRHHAGAHLQIQRLPSGEGQRATNLAHQELARRHVPTPSRERESIVFLLSKSNFSHARLLNCGK